MSTTIRKELYGAEVIGHEVLHENGSYRRVRYWLRGTVRRTKNWSVKYIDGWSGTETQVDVDEIVPIETITVGR
jgi:hypothetical protein